MTTLIFGYGFLNEHMLYIHELATRLHRLQTFLHFFQQVELWYQKKFGFACSFVVFVVTVKRISLSKAYLVHYQ